MVPRHLFAALIHVLLTGLASVSCKWCNRTVAETRVYPIMQYSMCQQSYRDSCSWLSSRMCTFYELVDCATEHNHTSVVYRLVAECCSGYYLDPETNSSCLKQPGKSSNYTLFYIGTEHEHLFGLSHGALAGVICAFLLMCCVVVLIIIHILKKRRKRKDNKKEVATEQEMNEKMITPTDVVQT